MSTSIMNLFRATCMVLILSAALSVSKVHADDDLYRVYVVGGGSADQAKKRLRRFHKELIEEVKPLTLSEAFIECRECKDLFGEDVVTTVQIWIQKDDARNTLGHIGAAFWRAYPIRGSGYTMTVDETPPPDPACAYPGPLCKSRPFCQSMGGCSENASPYPCKICDGNPATLSDASCAVPVATQQK